jgi:hypothetical protein
MACFRMSRADQLCLISRTYDAADPPHMVVIRHVTAGWEHQVLLMRQDHARPVDTALCLFEQVIRETDVERLEDLVLIGPGDSAYPEMFPPIIDDRSADDLIREDLGVEEKQLDLISGTQEVVQPGKLLRSLRAFWMMVRSRLTSYIE